MPDTAVTTRAAGLFLVLAAAAYDGLLTVAILFVATAFAVALNGGESIPPGTVVYECYLVVCAAPYFTWCWTHGGRTVGMRAWRLRLQRMGGGDASWRDALVRYCAALLSWAALGAGFAWMLIDSRRLSWHDRLSGTLVVRDP